MGKTPKRRAKRRTDPRRWLVLPLALGAAAAVGWGLLADPTPQPLSTRPEPPDARLLAQESAAAHRAVSEVQHAEIREASREQLLDILRSADTGDDR